MTREEAIQWLKVINTKKFGWDEFALQESQREIRERCEQGVREAVDMAIESLKTDAVQGEWIYDHHNDEHTCSVCGRKALCDDYVGIDWQIEVLSDYCPSCGARMKGGDSE